MGTDIHGIFQKHDGTRWVDVPSEYDFGRHYQLFAVLAGVRNGYGFAGIPTGEPVEPIAELRGLPPDFELDRNRGDCHPLVSADLEAPWRRKARREHPQFYEGEPLEVWMGDHSYSWLTADEMLAWFDAAPNVVHCGVMARDDYEQWDRAAPPQEYAGQIWGGGVVVVNDSEVEKQRTPNWTHIRCEWEASLAHELKYFFDEVRRLRDAHGQVRFVFGFDS